MSRRVVGDVAVRVGADVGPLKIGLQDADRSVGRFSQRSSARARALATAVRGVGLAAAAMGAAVAAGASRAISALDGIGKKSAQIGITAEALQELRFAAKSAGVPVTSLDSSLERFSKRLGEAQQGFGAAKKQLEELGLSADTLSKIPLDRALEIVGQRISELELPTQRAAAAAGLFGREGVAMVNMLKDGAAGLQQVRQDARDMGAVVANDVVKRAEDAEDRLGRLKDVITAQLSTALVEAEPLLIAVATGIAEIATAANTAMGAVRDFAAELLSGLKKSEEEIAAISARNERRSSIRQRTVTRNRGEDDGEPAPTLGEFIGGVGDALGLGEGGQANDPRGRKNAADAQQRERDAERQVQLEAWGRQAEDYVAHLERMGEIAEADRIARLEAQIAAAEEEAEVAQDTEETKTDIAKGGMSDRQKALEEHLRQMAEAEARWERERAAGIGQFWSDVTSLMQSENETAFKIGKAFSIAKAVIDGREAAIGAYKVGARIGGPPLGAAFAAASIAATAGMISQIINTRPGGATSGGSAPSGGGGGGGGGGAVAAQEAAPSGPRVSLTLIGDQGFSRAQIVQIAEALNDSGDDGQLVELRGRR